MLYTLIAIAAALAFAGSALVIVLNRSGNSPSVWMVPAGLSVLFFAFSVFAIREGGALGFWVEHTRHLWGNQIWVDLLIAIGVAWAFIVPQAKALGMRVLPWLAVIGATGSIGLLAMIARLLYLRDRVPAQAGS
ncbi:MAG: hypothetical protein AAGK21_04370 [Bacteroidota bacterium]